MESHKRDRPINKILPKPKERGTFEWHSKPFPHYDIMAAIVSNTVFTGENLKSWSDVLAEQRERAIQRAESKSKQENSDRKRKEASQSDSDYEKRVSYKKIKKQSEAQVKKSQPKERFQERLFNHVTRMETILETHLREPSSGGSVAPVRHDNVFLLSELRDELGEDYIPVVRMIGELSVASLILTIRERKDQLDYLRALIRK